MLFIIYRHRQIHFYRRGYLFDKLLQDVGGGDLSSNFFYLHDGFEKFHVESVSLSIVVRKILFANKSPWKSATKRQHL